MTRVVIAGRWDGGVPVLPTGEALDAIRRGLLAGASDPVVLTVPFGTGPTFDEAVAALVAAASFYVRGVSVLGREIFSHHLAK